MGGYDGWEGLSEADVKRLGAKRIGPRLQGEIDVVINERQPTPKPRKYRNQPTVIDGITFSSKREANRYLVLVQRMKAGDIRRLKCQPRYCLCPLVIEDADVRDVSKGRNSHQRMFVAEYVADFEYEESDRGYGGITWRLVVEDAKGMRTDVYKLKKRWFEAQYGVKISEV